MSLVRSAARCTTPSPDGPARRRRARCQGKRLHTGSRKHESPLEDFRWKSVRNFQWKSTGEVTICWKSLAGQGGGARPGLATRKHGWSKRGSSIKTPKDCMNYAKATFTPTVFSRRTAGLGAVQHAV